MSPTRVTATKPPRSNPISPEVSLLLAEDLKLSAREECIELCYRMDTFSDIKFIVGDEDAGPQRTYKLHRIVLAGQSPLLYQVCTSNKTYPDEGIPVPRVQPEIFDHIVKWLYKAKLTERVEDVAVLAKLYEAAEYLKIRELEYKVLEVLKQILDREREKELSGEKSFLDSVAGARPDGPSTSDESSIAPSKIIASAGGSERKDSKAKALWKEIIEKLSPRKKEGYGSKEDDSGNDSSFFTLRRAKTTFRTPRRGRASLTHDTSIHGNPLISSPIAISTPDSKLGTCEGPSDAVKPTGNTPIRNIDGVSTALGT
ncbi:hypothetical protein ABW20_dc0109385 [Dactylellina cionopaga]|nr:hypothetical protein ABW20_dc0109385 [Dactylellina cionopaga]